MVPLTVRTAPDPTPYFLRRRHGRFAQLGMRRQPQIIIRRQIDDVLAINGALRRLLVLKHTQIEVRALRLSSFIWSVRYDNCGREVVTGVISNPSGDLQI